MLSDVCGYGTQPGTGLLNLNHLLNSNVPDSKVRSLDIFSHNKYLRCTNFGNKFTGNSRERKPKASEKHKRIPPHLTVRCRHTSLHHFFVQAALKLKIINAFLPSPQTRRSIEQFSSFKTGKVGNNTWTQWRYV